MSIFAGNIETKTEIFDFLIKNNEIIVLKRDGTVVSTTGVGSLDLTSNEDVSYFITEYNYILGLDEVIQVKTIPEQFRFNNQQTTDMFVFHRTDSDIGIVLGRRIYPPLGYALFGGMVEINENFETNSIKELEEESGLSQSDIIQMKSIGNFDCKEIRGTLTTNLNIVEISSFKKEEIQSSGSKDYDDIEELCFFTESELNDMIKNGQVVPHHVELLKIALDEVR